MPNSGKISPFKFSIVRFIILFSILIITANTIIILYRGINRYHTEINSKKEEIESITRAFGDHTELTFLAVDVVLQRAVEKHHFNLLFGNNLQQDTENNIIAWVNKTPQISAMLMTNEYGEIKAIYRKEGYKLWMEGKEFVSQEDFFKKQMDEYDSLFVGKQKSFLKKNHAGFVVLSRRLEKLDGSFDGVIMAAINIDYLLSFFKTIEESDKTKLVLNKIPESKKLYNPYKKQESSQEKQFDDNYNLTSNYLSKEDNQKVILAKSTDNITDKLKIYSFLNIPSIQMQVGIVFDGDDVLKKWNSERLSDAILYFVFILFVLVITFFSIELARQIGKLRASEKKALSASKAKSDFLANMSHELRTPLNAIIGFSEMLTTEYFGKINDKQKERLKDIHGCGNHLLSLINDILEFSKGQAGKMEIRPEEVMISKVVTEVVRMFDERAKREGISITTDVSRTLPHVFVDKRKIKQILINLVSNSVKFSERGDVVNISAKINDNEEFVLAVKDSGIGIKEEDIPKALSAFGQVHKDRAIAGTGLGLPLCKLFTELHNGTLDIRSKFGSGTEVTITLPKKVIIRDKIEL